MEVADRKQPAVNEFTAPVVVCIAGAPEERARLAGLFNGVGVLVLAPDTHSAGTFLEHLRAGDRPAAPARTVSATEVISVGGLSVDVTHHEARWHGRPLALTPYELKVLGCLASHPGRVWTYRQLHDHAWENMYFTGPAALQSVIKRLRAKLRHAGLPMHIHAARGVGFRFDQAKEARARLAMVT